MQDPLVNDTTPILIITQHPRRVLAQHVPPDCYAAMLQQLAPMFRLVTLVEADRTRIGFIGAADDGFDTGPGDSP